MRKKPCLRAFLLCLAATLLPLVTSCGSPPSSSEPSFAPPSQSLREENDIYALNSSPAAAGTTIVISAPVTLRADLKLATDRAWEFRKGAVITTTGYTFDGNGAVIQAGGYQIFAGTGRVMGLKKAKPEYFGAVGDWNGSTGTDNTAAFQAAAQASKNIELERGGYMITDEIHFNPNSMGGNGGWRIAGAGNANSMTSGTFIYQAAPGKAAFVFGDVARLWYDQQSHVSDLGFKGVSSAKGIKLAIAEDTIVERCKFSAMARGIELATDANTQVVKPRIYDCRFQSLDYGIVGTGTRSADVWIENNTFQDVRLVSINLAGDADGGYILNNFFGHYDTSATPASRHIYLQVPNWFHIEGNQFFNSGAGDVELTTPRNNFISGNTFYRSSQQNKANPALLLSRQVVAVGPVFTGVVGGNNKITSNTFLENFGSALQIDAKASQGDLIEGNSFEGVGYGLTGAARVHDAIVVSDLDRAFIVNNSINGASKDGGYPTITTTAGSTSARLVSQVGGTLATGMALTGKGIAPNTTVTVSGKGLILSSPALLSVSSQPMKAGSIVTRYALIAVQSTNSTITGNVYVNCLFPYAYYSNHLPGSSN